MRVRSKALRERNDISMIFEDDIKITQRYMLSRNIIPLILTDVEGELYTYRSKASIIIMASQIKQESSDMFDDQNVLAFNVETYKPVESASDFENNPIVMVSFYSRGFKKVITTRRFGTEKGYIEFVRGEADLIARFKDIL